MRFSNDLRFKEKAVPMQKHIMLFWESKLIHKLRGKTFVPFLHFVGDEKSEDGKAYHVMVMDLLGKSLEDLFQECRRKFDVRTVCHIAVQMVSFFIQTFVKIDSKNTKST